LGKSLPWSYGTAFWRLSDWLKKGGGAFDRLETPRMIYFCFFALSSSSSPRGTWTRDGGSAGEAAKFVIARSRATAQAVARGAGQFLTSFAKPSCAKRREPRVPRPLRSSGHRRTYRPVDGKGSCSERGGACPRLNVRCRARPSQGSFVPIRCGAHHFANWESGPAFRLRGAPKRHPRPPVFFAGKRLQSSSEAAQQRREPYGERSERTLLPRRWEGLGLGLQEVVLTGET